MPNINRTFIKIIIVLIIFHTLSAIGVLTLFTNQYKILLSLSIENEAEYFNIAQGLINGKAIKTIRTIGLPLFFIPFIQLFRAVDIKQILVPVSLFNSLILYNISIILVALIALRLTNSLKIAIFTATSWTFFPWLVYLLVKVKPEYDYAGLSLGRLICQMFIYPPSDAISAFIVLLIVFLSIVFLEDKKTIFSFILGISFAISVLFRPQNIALLLLIASVFIKIKKLKSIFIFVITTLVIFIPQFIYNLAISGSIFNIKTVFDFENLTAREIGYPLPFYSVRSIPYILVSIHQRHTLYIVTSLGLISIVIVATLIDLYYKSRISFYLLISWILPYIIIYSLYNGTDHNILRFMMPIIPALLIIVSV